ncbi:hypothetical protein TcasGA2_TC034822 [Tribolium castaneum]|uniref:Uncharacterized protein n=1 Tax=Tribolium castaneum TaxID=7070 RepID=A0A139WE61_TRICA|nr:hypothetical protein TcasGA2_TC034822 [Tribolium castaneum]
MAVITKFCFSCSVRLGSIITGCLTLIQACAFLAITLNSTLEEISDVLNQWLSEIRLEEGVFKEIANNPILIVTISSMFFSCLVCSSVLLIYASFQTRPLLMYPFTIFYFLYILVLFGALLRTDLILKPGWIYLVVLFVHLVWCSKLDTSNKRASSSIETQITSGRIDEEKEE